MKNKVYIIAEMSANHCGDFNLAKKIIKTAKDIGADAIKLQTYTADTITIDCKDEPFMIKGGLWAGQSLYELYKKAYTPWEWQGELKKYADEIGIDFFSSPFDFSAIDFLEKIGVCAYKIASFEANDLELVKYAAAKQKPMIISSGVIDFDEILAVISACKSVKNNDITILKCTSEYPSKPENMNLLTIKDMCEKLHPLGVKIGLSDHSKSPFVPVMAVGLGARVVEKHLMIDKSLGGEDSGFSLDVNEFGMMVRAIRECEKSLGSVDYSVNMGARGGARSIFVCEDIKKGEIFTPKNIRSIRPAAGLDPNRINEVLGKKAINDFKKGTPLCEKMWE